MKQSKSNSWTCEWCDANFNTITQLDKHIRKHKHTNKQKIEGQTKIKQMMNDLKTTK